MNSSDVQVLEQVGITQLLAQTRHWADFGDGGVDGELRALDRLEQLGLVARSGSSVRPGVALTSAGVEALAYLAAS
ncbi:MAG TPA: hypothetical protein VG674_13765 [Amycolatopsis sp.]|nr:hypothetical protein [Amycolatopsis sp.]